MSLRVNATYLPWLLLAAACGAAPDAGSEAVSSDEEAIVRGQVAAAHPQVMALYIPNIDGTETLCTGTLYARRTVVTAAHCLQNAGAVLAYHGNDYWTDFEQLFAEPEAWVNWSNATDWSTHPNWNPTTLNSDIAIVHLDRDPPFAPLPLADKATDDRDIGKKASIVGFGASGTDEATGTQGVDAYVKRVGTTKYQGLPRLKPLPPHPHPGLGSKNIRSQLMQFDGTAPSANSCFGDSGGPALMPVNGKQRVVGVASWTGDRCEAFSYYVRTHDFLPFLKKAAAAVK